MFRSWRHHLTTSSSSSLSSFFFSYIQYYLKKNVVFGTLHCFHWILRFSSPSLVALFFIQKLYREQQNASSHQLLLPPCSLNRYILPEIWSLRPPSQLLNHQSVRWCDITDVHESEREKWSWMFSLTEKAAPWSSARLVLSSCPLPSVANVFNVFCYISLILITCG